MSNKKIIIIAFCVFILSSQIYAAPGKLDLSFPQVLASGANVRAIEMQANGKILVAGEFTTRGAVLRNDMIRLNTDGTLDSTFSIGTGTSQPSRINFIKVQPDGKILIAGYITQLNEVYGRSIRRLNQEGSEDTTFNQSGIDVVFVFSLDIQSDGKILIAAMNLAGFTFVTRLKNDGSNDQGVGQPLYFNGAAVTYLPAENKILIGGRFTYTVNQTQYQNLVKLNVDGTIDQTFTASVINSDFDLRVKTTPLASGKILVWGKFDSINGTTRRNIAVLNSNGSLDTTFNPATTGAETISAVAVQANGKIIIGGTNFTFNTLLRGNVARLNADGTTDKTFNQGRGANGDVNSMIIRNNNKLLIGGTFFRYHIFPRSGLAQVNL